MSFKQEMIKLKDKTKMEKRIEDRIYLNHQIDSIKNDIRHKIVKNPNVTYVDIDVIRYHVESIEHSSLVSRYFINQGFEIMFVYGKKGKVMRVYL